MGRNLKHAEDRTMPALELRRFTTYGQRRCSSLLDSDKDL